MEAYTIRVKPPEGCLIPELADVLGKANANVDVLDCDAFNREVKKINGYVEGMTTYSLRRAFIHQVIRQHTVGEVTAWLAVARLTGHHQLEVLRTSYAPAFADTL